MNTAASYGQINLAYLAEEIPEKTQKNHPVSRILKTTVDIVIYIYIYTVYISVYVYIYSIKCIIVNMVYQTVHKDCINQ